MSEIIANLNPAKVIVRASECMRRLMEAGLSYEALQFPIDFPDVRAKIVNSWMKQIVFQKAVASLKKEITHAREIMGKNFLGVDKALCYFKLEPTEKVIKTLNRTFPKKAELIACKDTHILVADFGISLRDIYKHAPQLFCRKELLQISDRWVYYAETPKWRLIRKTEVSDSFNKDWYTQFELLTKEEMVPTVRQVVYGIILNYLVNGERLFNNKRIYDFKPICFRTKDKGFEGQISFCWDGGLRFFIQYDNGDKSIGLVSAQKPVCR